MKQIDGYRYRLAWPATSLTVRVNARDEDEAYRKLWRWLQRGAVAHFLGTCEPWPKNPRRLVTAKKVF